MTAMVIASPFAQQLRHWRGLRRISQLDLAIRTETSQRYLSFLEQGRSQPGRTMVVRLAESLELSLRERNSLLLAAGYAPVFAESAFDAPELGAVRDALDSILRGHMPYPAVVTKGHGELVSANGAFELLTEGAPAALLEQPVNVLRLALHSEGLARRVRNLPEWGRHITDALRGRDARSPDPARAGFITELESYLPPLVPGPEHVGFSVPLRLHTDAGELSLITTISTFSTATDVTLSELHLEAFLPADRFTADYLRSRFSPE